MAYSNSRVGNSAFKAGMWYTISTVVLKAVGIITLPIYTRLLSTSDYGIASTFTSWYSLLIVVSSLDLVLSVGRAKQDYKEKLNEYIGSLQVLSSIFTLIMFLVSLIFWNNIQEITELDSILLLLLFLYLFITPAVQLAQTKFRYEYKYKENIFILVFTSLSSIFCSLVLIFLIPQYKYLGKILGTIIPTFLLGLYFWIKGIKSKAICINVSYWKYALSISIPMIIHSISLNVLATSDRVIITKYIGMEATGIYTLAYQYSILVNIIMGAINQAWQPWFHDNLFEGNKELIKLKTKDLTCFGCFIGIACISIAPEMLKILGPKEYQDGVWVVTPVVLGIICQFMYTNYINIELHMKNTKYASFGTIIAAILNIILNIIFIPQYGIIAAAYTTLFSYIILLLIHFIITRKILLITIYDDRFFVKAYVIAIMLGCLMTILFDIFLLRFLLITILGIGGLLKYRNELKGIIKKYN